MSKLSEESVQIHLGSNSHVIPNPRVKKSGMVTISYEEAIALANALNNMHRPALTFIKHRKEILSEAQTHQAIYERMINLALSLDMLQKNEEEGQ